MNTPTKDLSSMNTFDFWDNGTILSCKISKAVNALCAIDTVMREGIDHPRTYSMGLDFITETLIDCARELNDFTEKAFEMNVGAAQKS